MSNMTRTERRTAGLTLALLSLTLAACSGSATVPEGNETVPTLQPTQSPQPEGNAAGEAAQDLRATGAPAPAPKSSDQHAASKVLGKKDEKMVNGKIACYIDFVYAGEEPQQTIWIEPCAKVTTGMMARAEMEKLGWWEKLDESQRGYVEKMPGGLTLFVEGEVSAAIYPNDETGTTAEIFVAD